MSRQVHGNGLAGENPVDTTPLLNDEHHTSVPTTDVKPRDKTILKTLAWYIVLLLVHVGWGLLPVSARYMQVYADPPMGPFRVGFYMAAIASACLICFTYIPHYVRVTIKRCQGVPQSAPSRDLKGRLWEWVSSLAILAISLGVLAFGQILATDFTSGSWVQLVSMTGPLFVAVLASIVLNVPIPKILYPTLVVAISGAGLVIYGGMHATGETTALSPRDIIGFAIAFVATLGMAIFYVFVQKTEGLVNEDEVLVCEYLVMVGVLPFLSLVWEGMNWTAILHYDWRFWSHLLGSSVLVYYGCNLVQQYVIRNVGANIYAMTIPLRLVSSIVGSWILLGEKIESWMQWTGSGILVLAIIIYLYFQFQKMEEVEGDEEEIPVTVYTPSRSRPISLTGRSFVGYPGSLSV